MPEPSELSAATIARQRAFRPLQERAEVLRQKIERLPAANVAVTPYQYVMAMDDANVVDAVLEITGGAHDLARLDFTDSAVIGGSTRKALERFVGSIERVYNATRVFAWFIAPAEYIEWRRLMIEIASNGASLACALLSTLVASSTTEAMRTVAEAQRSLRVLGEVGRLGAPEIPDADDLDERVSLALGVNGTYTDEYGALDVGQIVAVARSHGSPFEVMAQGGVRFFSHLLPRSSEMLGPEASGLAIAALPLSALDRPLAGHRIAMLTTQLANEAYRVAPDRVLDLVRRAASDGERVFASAMRTQRDWRRLAHDPNLAPHDVIANAILSYKRLAEGAFRSGAALIRGLLYLVNGKPIAADPNLPMLGVLVHPVQGVTGSQAELWDLVTASLDPALRNAEAHEDFVIDDEELVHIGDEVRDVRELEALGEKLIGAITGMDAGVLCFSFDSGIADAVSLTSDRSGALARVLADLMLGAYGLELHAVELKDSVLCVDVEDHRPDEGLPATIASILPAFAALTPQFPDAEVFRVRDVVNGETILEMARQSYEAWHNEPLAVKDLATICPLLDASVRSGHDHADVLRQVLALAARLVVADAVEQGGADGWDVRALRRIAQRLTYVIRLSSAHHRALGPETRRVVQKMRTARDLATRIIGGNSDAGPALGRELAALIDWSAEEEIQLFEVA